MMNINENNQASLIITEVSTMLKAEVKALEKPNNLALWDSVKDTDRAHVKKITGKAYQGDSPKPHYIVRRATEAFGPCGIGWGFKIIEEKLLDGALLAPGFYQKIHMATIRVWFEWNGKRGEVEHVGQTVFCGIRSKGDYFTDEDAPKKSVTDGLIKALSMLGFAGDIFMGEWSDSKYHEPSKPESSKVAAPKLVSRETSPEDENQDKEAMALEWFKGFREDYKRMEDKEVFVRANSKRLANCQKYDATASAATDFLGMIG